MCRFLGDCRVGVDRRSDGGPSPEQRHQCQRVQRHGRNQDEQRRVIERPVRTRSLGSPEHPERDQHDPDDELHAVLRNAGQRRPHREADGGHHQHSGDRGGGGQWDVVLIGAEGQGDECHFQALEHDALVRQREGVPVDRQAAALERRPCRAAARVASNTIASSCSAL